MNILLDGNEANVSQRVGSNVYAFELLKHLEEISRSLPDSFTVVLAQPPVADWPAARQGWTYEVIGPKPFWTQWALPLYLYQNFQRYDILFTPGHYAPRLCPIPYISSVMDLAYLHFPKQFKRKDYLQLKHWTAYSIKRAQHVIAISNYTKADIISTYGLAEKNVSVIYPAVNPPQPLQKNQVASVFKKTGIKPPYFVYVGTLQPRKNLERLISAYEMYRRQLASLQLNRSVKKRLPHTQVQLVIAGKIGWLADSIVKRAQESSFKNDIMLTGYVSESEKNALVHSSLGLVQVGLHEGFGIPALEALHLGTIPVVSNSSSLPEVVGKAGILVDPLDIHSISQGLLEASLLTQRQRSLYAKEARLQKDTFNWYFSAQKLLDILHQIAR